MNDKLEPKEEKKVEHGYPNCDCDLEGGDPNCKIEPPYKTLAQRYEEALAIIQQKDERITELEEAQEGWDHNFAELREQIAELENANINLKEGRK